MSREPGLDLEAASPAAGLLRPPPAASPIAQERVAPGRPSAGFAVAALALAAGTLALALALGARGAPVAAETAAQGLSAWGLLGVPGGRIVAAAAQAAAVGGTAMAGRRLSHSEGAGLLAAALVAADPAGLLLGSLAVPQQVAAAGLLWALAFATSPIPLLHWGSGLALGVATLAVPAAALWVLPLGIFLLLRGHIYAAPQHFALALLQVAGLPLAAFAVRAATDGVATVPACLAVAAGPSLLLLELAEPGPGLLALPGPVTWFAGAGALAFFGLGAAGFALGGFRIARAPGRLQVRLVSALHPALGRGAWLLLLVLAAPPLVWLPLFAIALAMGVRELGDDAPGFGLAVALVLLAFAGVVLWRAWDAVAGGAVADAIGLVPWADPRPC